MNLLKITALTLIALQLSACGINLGSDCMLICF